MRLLLFILSFSTLFFGCGPETEESKKTAPKANPPKVIEVNTPAFNEDSAYQYVAKQVDFGPRVPNSTGHQECKDWLITILEGFADKVYQQSGVVTAYNGDKLNFTNIIAAFNPDNKKRVLLCAHWDTRPYGDQDDDPEKWREPILGANDGGSGVGVLLEVARQLSIDKPELGIDIILFDAEDYGQPEFSKAPPKRDSYALGSQYWSKNKHVPGYMAKYGILLDMIGAENSQFRQEAYSRQFASSVLQKVWGVAGNLGYSQYFLFEAAGPIQDDHFYVNAYAGIPTIDIIHLEPSQIRTFHSSWHTHDDNMDVIDKNTLKAVGQTVLEVLYREDAGSL